MSEIKLRFAANFRPSSEYGRSGALRVVNDVLVVVVGWFLFGILAWIIYEE